MHDFDKKISGPVNIVRLEGTINNIKKIIYIFMDYHLNSSDQMECYETNVLPVRSYLTNVLKKKDKTYDIFIEVTPLHETNNKSGNYISSMQQLYVRNKKKKDNTYLRNVRLHYIDVREVLLHNELTILTNLPYILSFNLNVPTLNKYLNDIKLLINSLQNIYNALFEDDIINKTESPIINKIKAKYKNNNVKKILTDILINKLKTRMKKHINICKGYIEQITQITNYIIPYLNKRAKNIILIDNILKNGHVSYNFDDNVIETLDILTIKLYYLFGKLIIDDYGGLEIMDLYLLRRILDKDYIHNSIIYTGLHHSMNYIFNLVKYFDFKITHYSYLHSKNKNINKIIKESETNYGIWKYFLPTELGQCSDISSFPENLD